MKKRDDKAWLDQTEGGVKYLVKNGRTIFLALLDGKISIWKEGRGGSEISNEVAMAYRYDGSSTINTNGTRRKT